MLPNDIGAYETKMKDFAAMETKALEVYMLDKNAPTEKVLASINAGIYHWKKNLGLVQEAGRLNIPEPLHAQNKKLEQYCRLRLQSYELLYKSIYENTDAYDAGIKDLTNQINVVIDDISKGADAK